MGNDQSGSKKSGQGYHPDIVVVSEKNEKTGPGYQLDDNAANRLQYIPLYYPIIKSRIGLKDDEKHKEVDSEPIIRLCNRVQNHLNLCAETVTFDQNALISRIKEIDFVANTLMQSYTERQKKYAKYCEQFICVKEISSNLKKIQRNIDEILPMMETINNALPESERLEEFELSERK